MPVVDPLLAARLYPTEERQIRPATAVLPETMGVA